FFQAEDDIRDRTVTGVQTCALPILVDEETLRRIQPLENLPTPGHSVLQKCTLDGELCILKGSEAQLCDLDGLQQLVTGGPRPRRSEERRVGKAARWGGVRRGSIINS